MSWAKLDDDFYAHPKVTAVGNAGAGLFARLMSYCARHLTDGHVPESVMAMLAGPDGQPLVDLLIATGMVERSACNPVTGSSGYWLPGYLDRNPTAEAVRQERARKAKNVASFRAKKAAETDRDPVEQGSCNRDTNRTSNPVSNHVPVPVDLSSLRSERSPLKPPQGGPAEVEPSAGEVSECGTTEPEAPPLDTAPANKTAAASPDARRRRPDPRGATSPTLPGLEGAQTPERPDAQCDAAAGAARPEAPAPPAEGPAGQAEAARGSPRRRKRAPTPPRVDLDPAELAEGPERATHRAILADPTLSRTVAYPAQTARDLAKTALGLFDPAAEAHEAGAWTRAKPGRDRPNGAAFLANWFSKARRDAEVRRAVLETTRASGASSAQGAPAARQGSGFVPPVAPPMYRAPKGPTTP
jgi:hypothetical protein